MGMVLLFFGIVLTIALPVISIPFNILGMMVCNGRIRKGFGLLLALSLAFVAGIWVPDSTADLFRHHQQVGLLSGFNYRQLGVFVGNSLEPMHYLIEFVVAQTNNYNILQFIVVSCGYSELFWIICDYADLKKIKTSHFIIGFLYAFSSILFINFASGLWFNFAIINIAMGIYCHYFRRARLSQYLFFALAVCLHLGALYLVLPIILLINLSLFRKIRISTALLVFLIAVSVGGILIVLGNIFGDESIFAKILNEKYDSYFVNDSQFGGLHVGWNLYLPVINVIFCSVISFFPQRKERLANEYNSFIVYLSIIVLASILNAGVFVRYGSLMMILASPIIMNFYIDSYGKKARSIMTGCLIALCLLQFSKSLSQIESTALPRNIKENLTQDVFYLLSGEEYK